MDGLRREQGQIRKFDEGQRTYPFTTPPHSQMKHGPMRSVERLIRNVQRNQEEDYIKNLQTEKD